MPWPKTSPSPSTVTRAEPLAMRQRQRGHHPIAIRSRKMDRAAAASSVGCARDQSLESHRLEHPVCGSIRIFARKQPGDRNFGAVGVA